MPENIEMNDINSNEENFNVIERKYIIFPFFVGSQLDKHKHDLANSTIEVSVNSGKNNDFEFNTLLKNLVVKDYSLDLDKLNKILRMPKYNFFNSFSEKGVEPRLPALIEPLLKKCIEYIAMQISEFAELYHPLINEKELHMITPYHIKDLPVDLVKLIYARVKETNKKLPRHIEDFFSQKLIDLNPGRSVGGAPTLA